jgi:isoleucyl-tRNA synthetase
VWQHHPALLAECESVHLARWPEGFPASDEEWSFLAGARDAVNAAIEPLRASRALATTAEAEVTIAAPPAVIARLERYAGELAAFLLVARVELAAGRDGDGMSVAVRQTASPKCERCWTYRSDVAAAGPRAGLCARCAAALEAAGR